MVSSGGSARSNYSLLTTHYSLLTERIFDPPVRYQPHHRHEHIDEIRDPGRNEGRTDRCQVEDRRNLALEIGAERLRQHTLGTMAADDGPLQQVISSRRHQERDAIECG